ncbi:MAG TPA: PQQ-binding-like beta-propeller repeat protein [Acidimicrobiales bacterium]|nr:PQQ-binding-like beta-propeller repeat protein [Acidimicrobiales bacterium]
MVKAGVVLGLLALFAVGPAASISASASAASDSAGGASAAPHVDATTSWTVYHGNPLGTGVDTSGVTFSPPNHAWTSPVLDGQVYGEPLVTGSRVFVATENDTIYALSADNGSVLWSTHVGTPVPSSDLPCGDITPQVGITGTPVVDPSTGEIFAVADELVSGTAAHFLVGLDIYTGAQRFGQVAVDPPGSSPPHLLQRTGLNLDDGNVVFGYGGNDDDCEPYHGWVVSVPETPTSVTYFDTTGTVSNGTQGAVWMGGAAPEVDSGGNIWVSTGNGSSASPYDGSDSVLELSSALNQKQLFAPSDWSSDNSHDRDLGSAPPALLSDGTALQVGKSQTGFLLNQANLVGIGGQITSAPVCTSNDSDGGNAILGTVVFIPCLSGIEAIQTTPSTLSVQWSAGSGEAGPPIIAGGLVWTIGNGNLYGLNPSTGTVTEQVTLGSEANHFPTPSVGDGLLLAPTSDQVMAFSGSAGVPSPPPPPPPPPPNSSYWLVASDGGIFSFGGAPFYGSTGGMPLNQPVVGMASTASEHGYWFVASDGGIFAFGDAPFLGSEGAKPLNAPIVGMAATPDGGGYWLVASDGGVFSFGDAKFFGSMGGQKLNAPILGMATTHDGLGYWMVAADGGIFAFGDAAFHGSMGGTPLNKPIVGMASTTDGLGYWAVASDGGIFAFGDAPFFGSAGGTPLNEPVVGMARTNDGEGYWLAASDGGVFNYGDARFSGSMGGTPLNKPVVGMAPAG